MSNRILELKNLSGEQLLSRAGDVLPPWVALLLVLAIAWQLSRITWLVFPQGEANTSLPAGDGAAVVSRALPAVPVDYDVGRIAAANLFGQRPAVVQTPVVDDFEELDETQLNLTLRGTIAGNSDQLDRAIIANDRGEEEVYTVGEEISAGRKLHSVLPDRAILNHNGELEALRLLRESDSASVTPQRTSRNTRMPARNSVARELQATLQQNPAKLTDLIRPQPVFSNGKQLGYRVYPGRRRQQFVSLGLKPGDLVTEINGTRLDDPAKGAEIFSSLANSNQVTVTVERNGSPQVLVLDTEQLSIEGGQKR